MSKTELPNSDLDEIISNVQSAFSAQISEFCCSGEEEREVSYERDAAVAALEELRTRRSAEQSEDSPPSEYDGPSIRYLRAESKTRGVPWLNDIANELERIWTENETLRAFAAKTSDEKMLLLREARETQQAEGPVCSDCGGTDQVTLLCASCAGASTPQ